MLTRWAVALQIYDFTVKHAPGKLNVVPDTLSRAFSEVNGEPIPCEPRLAAICRNVPIDGPYHPPGPASTNSPLLICTMYSPSKETVNYS